MRSISFRTSSKATSLKHNNRTLKSKDELKDYGNHINWDRTKDNTILFQKNIEDVYNEEFGSAVDEYNSKQKRKDRKISTKKNGYLKKVRQDKNLDGQREFIVQFGRQTDEQFSKDTYDDLFSSYVKKFSERYPNMDIYNAVIHYDEGTPHMHMNIVPVGKGYKRGMSKRPSFKKALANDNISFNDFMEQNREDLSKIMKDKTGEETKKIGSHDYVKPQQYRELMEKGNNYYNQSKAVYSELQNQKSESSEALKKNVAMNKELEDRSKKLDYREGIINKSGMELGMNKSKFRIYKDNKTSELDDREKELNTKESSVSSREQNVSKRENLASKREKQNDDREERLKQIERKLNDYRKQLIEYKNKLVSSWNSIIHNFKNHLDSVSETKKKTNSFENDLGKGLSDLSQSKSDDDNLNL